MSERIIVGNCLEKLKDLDTESVDCCVTSPPYFGLRDYGTATWEGGDQNCDHKGKPFSTKASLDENFGNKQREKLDTEFFKEICGKCGAKRIDSQLGLELTPEDYVNNMVLVFKEVKRVLKKEGTLWLNLGDSYNGSGGDHKAHHKNDASFQGEYSVECGGRSRNLTTLKPKDLIGIPWRTAFALQSDGWYLRQDIIWHKPNPMPESVTDRCTKSHEYIFLLSKSQKYYFDNVSIKEPMSGKPHTPGNKIHKDKISGPNDRGGHSQWEDSMDKEWGTDGNRNKRSVWTITTKPFKEAHFATFPEDLILPCILAGCPNRGTVLDPFSGSGTTGVVSKKNNRNYIGIELNPAYVDMAQKRLNNTVSNSLVDFMKIRSIDGD